MEKHLRKVRAVFEPHPDHVCTLREEVKGFIGKEYLFQYVWIMEENEQFPGMWAMMPRDPEMKFVHWVPEFDLKILN